MKDIILTTEESRAEHPIRSFDFRGKYSLKPAIPSVWAHGNDAMLNAMDRYIKVLAGIPKICVSSNQA